MEGKFYHYKGKLYLVKNLCIIKGKEDKQGVIYYQIIDGILQSQIYVRELEDFIKKFEYAEINNEF